jgi:hypothetical protein
MYMTEREQASWLILEKQIFIPQKTTFKEIMLAERASVVLFS